MREDDDLCLRLIQAGGAFICHECFVHHHGHATFDGNGLEWFDIQQDNINRFLEDGQFIPIANRARNSPFLSACMIVKDEADILALPRQPNGLVDEVVIYDTGSTDDTTPLPATPAPK